MGKSAKKIGGGAVGTVLGRGNPLGMVVGAVGGGNPIKGASSIWGDITGANAAAKAAEKAALAEQAAAGNMRAQVLLQAQQNMTEGMALAEATPQELAALDRSMSSAQKQLDREEKMLAAIDPAILEASSQALALLRGESAGINKPMTDMRNMQRQQLVNSLRSQYGPGAESSSIGQQALQQFDMESNSMFAQNQQASLGQLFGIAGADLGARTSRGIGQLQQVGQGYSALQDRKLNARMNLGGQTLGALTGTSQQMIQTAGAPFVGDALRAQAQGQFANLALRGGMAFATGGMSEAAQAGGGLSGLFKPGGGGSGGYQVTGPQYET